MTKTQQVHEILKRVKKVEVKTRKPVASLISGNYRSIFKGRGIEFSEVREYVPGDDVRAIDWNVTARFSTPYVKECTEERDLNVYVVFDVSASNRFGSQKSKMEVGHEIAASLMLAAVRNNDNIGLCLFTDKVEKFIKPAKGRRHALRLLRELIYHDPSSKKTDIKAALAYLNRLVRKRSVIFVVSDCISNDFEKPLKSLSKRHDLTLINLSDAHEEELPDLGYMFIEDAETGEQAIVDTSDKAFREAYSKRVKSAKEELHRKARTHSVGMINVRTDEPFHAPLRRFFSMQEKRAVR